MDGILSDTELHTIAKEQLGLDPESDDQVPAQYVDELRQHTRQFPYDTQFILSPQPGTGYGHAMCLETDCGFPSIALGPLAGYADGGRTLGIGSLSTYREHILSSPSHISSRNERLQIMGNRVDPVMMSSSPTTPNHNHTHMLTTMAESEQEVVTPSRFGPSPILPTGFGMPEFAVKDEPIEPMIPRKRPSDFGLTRFPAPFPEESISDKRPRIEAPKESMFDDPFDSYPAFPFSPTVEDTRAKLEEIIIEIAHVQASLQKAQRKPNMTKGDLTRLARLEESLKELQAQREAYSASIPTASAKPLSHTSAAVNTAPFVKTEPMKTEPVASGSNVQLHTAFQNAPYPLHASTYAPIYSQPVASGSNVRIEGPITPADSDDHWFTDEPSPPSSDDYEQLDMDFYGHTQYNPPAKADDIDKFLVAAGNAEQFDGNESIDKALEKLNLRTLYETLPGMQVALMPHQTIGVAWMLEKERNPAMMGGCLADEMGLGKTVQMIAVIASNRPRTNDTRKSTLIVCPVALLDQWHQEIELKAALNASCLIYHGNNKPKRAEEIAKYDIVLTTFHTLAYEWPDLEAEELEKEKARRRQGVEVKPKKRRGAKKELGNLFLVNWFRVVIDEAQNIRNRRTRVSRAVHDLDSIYRWCLTGTPIINTLSDAYGMLRFLRIRPWYDWPEFNSKITKIEKKNPSLASNRLQAIFKAMLLRRKKDTKLEGKPLIQLPSKEVSIHRLEFTEEEREIYSMVEAKAQAKFNRFLRAGTVLKNYHHVFATLLRLRQICVHPILIQEQADEDGYIHGDEEGHMERELARAKRLVSEDFVTRMKKKFKEIADERVAAEMSQSDEAGLEGEECPICYDALTDAIVTRCAHVFCRECIANVLNAAARHDANEPNQYKPNERPCPSCRGAISNETIFSRKAFEPTDEEMGKEESTGDNVDMDDDFSEVPNDVKGKGKAPARRVLPRRRSRPVSIVDSSDEESKNADDDVSDFIVDDDEDEEEADARIALKQSARRAAKRAVVLSDDEDDNAVIYGAKPADPAPNAIPEKVKMMSRFLPSTKMKYMMDCLLGWAQEHPDEKVLIISQWTQGLDLVSTYLIEKGFAHVKYQGNMTRNQRDASVRSFMAKEKATIMLMSLKCGGVGLNLTRANRVISLDLGWSEAIESQAFDRVHRLGQTRPVTVERLVISGTVEDRILALQEQKKNLADGSLGEGNGKKIGRLTVKQLASLFNMDTHGNVLN